MSSPGATTGVSSLALWRLAYGKHAGKWCLFIEYLTEDRNAFPEDGTYEAWLFKDAPRGRRGSKQ